MTLALLKTELGDNPFSKEMGALDVDEQLPDDLRAGPLTGRQQAALAALYGDDCPLLKTTPTEDDWAAWASALWDRHRVGVQQRLHLVERDRLFRKGVQWITASGYGPWREPPKPRDAARVVYNMVAPALDLRAQIVNEQRPGFRVNPASQDPDDLKKAEAKQVGLEYQYNQQNMEAIKREIAYWVGTDGVAFTELFWDAERGPWDEMRTPEGGPADADSNPAAAAHKYPMGEIGIRVRRIEQVRVSADATATNPPWYWVIRERMPRAQAVREYGETVAEADEGSQEDQDSKIPPIKGNYVLPDEQAMYSEQAMVDRFTIYCRRSEYLPNGVHLIVVGGKLVRGPMPMPVENLMVRWTDGSSDPSFFPQPEMDKWTDSQQRMNAVLSKWVENVRLNAGPRMMAKEGALTGETLLGSTMSVIGVKGLDDINKMLRPLDGMSLAPDAKALFDLEKKTFEDLSGWNDVTRGSFSSEQSGRAILAIREQLERVFAPQVASFAQSMTEWAKITLSLMRWGYDQPRTLAVEGKSRPDLARAFTADDFDGVADVFVDPETMMPMPRAMRLFLLDDALQKQIIGPQEYRRRLPFAMTRNLGTPDEDQEAHARRLAEFIRQTGSPPMPIPYMWVLDEAIHQDVLQREFLLAPDTPPQLQAVAFGWWQMFAQQAAMKMGGMPPAQPQGPPRPQGGMGGASPMAAMAGMTPGQQPMMRNNPSVNPTAQGQAAQTFEQTAQR